MPDELGGMGLGSGLYSMVTGRHPAEELEEDEDGQEDEQKEAPKRNDRRSPQRPKTDGGWFRR